MHEASICASLLDIVVEEANRCHAEKIVGVRVKVGIFAAVEPHALSACFELFTEGTIADGATLTVDRIPANAVCRKCGHSFDFSSLRDLCPHCGSNALDVSGGHDIMLADIEAISSTPDTNPAVQG